MTSELSRIPYVNEYLDVWAMHEPVFRSLYDHAQALDVAAHMQSEYVRETIDEVAKSRSDGPASSAYRTTVTDHVAVVRANGTLMKQASSFTGGTSTVMLRQSIRSAVRDEQVGAIMLAIDSPGGTAAGTHELAQEIARADQSKPVLTHFEDLGASAAYWAGCQARSVAANEPAKIGSIGTYAVVHDLSAMAAKEGIKVHIIRAGSQHKGAGQPGTEITAEQLAEFQRLVDLVNGFFLNGVSSGRKMDMAAVNQVADGRVHIAADAKSLGLIDHVRTFEESFAEAAALASRSTTVRGAAMSDTKTETSTPQAANHKEIKAACPGITADKVLEYMDADKTVDQCKDAWMEHLSKDNATKSEEISKLKSESSSNDDSDDSNKDAEKPKQSGVAPLVDKGEGKGTAVSAAEAYRSAIKETMKDENCNRSEAAKILERSQPGMRQAMVDEINAASKS